VLRLDGGPQSVLLLAELRGHGVPEVVGGEHLADLDLVVLERRLPDPLDDLLARGDLQDPEAGDEFLRLGEGPPTTVVLPSLSNRTRAPLELGCSPSPASMTPALTSSSL
jgi:hypothetical protein